ncbi:MAG: hypothetical protein HC921_05745 [Synechococcaceae cyanobacterium SM2_3_1]|nr:hypothetical protein [Synechococcaceae cyanobacterium SM2_3_1]
MTSVTTLAREICWNPAQTPMGSGRLTDGVVVVIMAYQRHPQTLRPQPRPQRQPRATQQFTSTSPQRQRRGMPRWFRPMLSLVIISGFITGALMAWATAHPERLSSLTQSFPQWVQLSTPPHL